MKAELVPPLLLIGPGIAPKLQGKFEDQPSHVIDFMATCLDLRKWTTQRKLMDKMLCPYGVSLKPVFGGAMINRAKPLYWGIKETEQFVWETGSSWPRDLSVHGNCLI